MVIRRSILVLILIGLAIYFNALLNGFVWDDYPQIIRNTQVHSLKNIFDFFKSSTFASGGSDRITGLYYRPIMSTAYALFYTLAGPNPLFFHLGQVLIHICNSIFLFLFFRWFFSNRAAFFLSLIFLVHPVNIEAVSYIAALQDTLFFFFGILGLLLLQKKILKNKQFILLFFLLLMSLLSKETGIAFIFTAMLFTLLFRKKYIKFVLLSTGGATGLYLFLRFFFAHIQSANWSIAPIFTAPLTTRLLNIPTEIVYYLRAFFIPWYISTNHFWMIKNPTLTDFSIPLLVVIVFMTICLYIAHYIYKHKKKSFGVFIFFFVWFVFGLLLHLHLIPIDMTVADRWFYFPSVGLYAMIFVCFKTFNVMKMTRLTLTILVLIITALSVRTIHRNFQWRDDLTLYANDINVTRKNFVLDNAYATELIKVGDFTKAKKYIADSIKEKPYYANLNNMAIVLVSENKIPEAKYYLAQAAKDSVNFSVYENYSSFLVAYGGLEEAEVFTKRALNLYPHNSLFWLNLAKIQYLQKRKAEAIASAKKAYEYSGSADIKEFYMKLASDKPVRIPRHSIEY